MKRVSEAVARTWKAMHDFTRPGITTKQLDDFGAEMLRAYGAHSAPHKTYGFPGFTCISVNHEIAHGIPSANRIIQDGDLINIDVSAELDGFWGDNGGSFVVGNGKAEHYRLVEASREILNKAIANIKGGVRISDIGSLIETEARHKGYRVIRNLTGHGIGRSLHEEPHEIANYRDRFNTQRFRKNAVVAVETFIATHSTLAKTLRDGWTLVGNKGGFVAQHEHTLVVTEGHPIILTSMNGI